MKIVISIDDDALDNAAFEDDPRELDRLLLQAVAKATIQLREYGPELVCDAPESSNTLLDINGNRVGSVLVERRK